MTFYETKIPDIYFAFSPIFYLSKLFGIMPFRYNRKAGGTGWLSQKVSTIETDHQKQLPFTEDKRDIAYAIVSLILTILHGMSAPIYVLGSSSSNEYRQSVFMYNLFTSEDDESDAAIRKLYDKDTKQSLVMKVLNPLLVTLMCVGTRLVALYPMRFVLPDFFNKLTTADRFMKRIKHFSDHINDRNHRRCAVVAVLYFTVLSLPINLYYLYSVSGVTSLFGIVWCTVLVWSNLTSFCGDLQFIFSGYLLKMRFKLINDTLRSLSVEQNELSYWELANGDNIDDM